MGLRELKAMYSLNNHPDVNDLLMQNIVAARKECDASHRHESHEDGDMYRIYCVDCQAYV